MEAGYNSHPSRLGAEGHYGEDNMFNQGGPYVVSTPSYFFNSSSPVKPSNLKGDNPPLEMCMEDTLARRLMILTSALNQGKPIRVDDLLSLRPDQTEVRLQRSRISSSFKSFNHSIPTSLWTLNSLLHFFLFAIYLSSATHLLITLYLSSHLLITSLYHPFSIEMLFSLM